MSEVGGCSNEIFRSKFTVTFKKLYRSFLLFFPLDDLQKQLEVVNLQFGIRPCESKGTPPRPPPPGNKALLRDY